MNNIALITFGVRDIAKARDFYTSLGFSTSNNEENPGIVIFDCEGTTFSLYPIDDLAKDIDEANPPKVNECFAGITLAHNVSSKESVDEIFQNIENLGGKIVKKPQEVFWGGYHGYFRDVDGYYWEVAYPYPK